MTEVKKTPRKRPAKKKAPKPKRIQVIETKTLPLADLTMYYKNPRIGDVDAIAESLRENGQFKAICVNIGTYTGREYEILGGNHTYLAMRKNGENEILASLVDVDDEQATKIVLADNATADKGTYDDAIIADLFASLPTFTGTGYTDVEVDAILAAAADTATNVLTGLEEEEAEEREAARGESFEGTGLGDEDDEFDDAPSANGEVETRIERQSDELPGLAELKEELPTDDKSYMIGKYDLPKLRADMLVKPDEIPANLLAWAGSATKAWPDPDQWWLYNWGIDSTSGMNDVSKVIVSFYCWDENFENWFWSTKKYVTKLINSKIKMMVTPNYSVWGTQSRLLNMWAIYRSRYVGRYAQEAGLKIIPDINWIPNDPEFTREVVLSTLPKKIPVASIQLQTFEKNEPVEEQKKYTKLLQEILDYIKPDALIVYANPAGHKYFEEEINYTGQAHLIQSRLVALGEAQKNRTKKSTI